MRIALMSSPRCGTVWMRSSVANSLGYPQLPFSDPDQFPASFPDHAVLQVHWWRTPELVRLVRHHGFRVLVLTRHPLDAFVSMLRLTLHDPDTDAWLRGGCAIPDRLGDLGPTSKAFRTWALSDGAATFLAPSREWGADPDAIRLRYEMLADETTARAAFGQLAAALGVPQITPRTRKEMLEARFHHHLWRGLIGQHRRVLMPELAHEIYDRHRGSFDTSCYSVQDYTLSLAQAEENWRAFA